MDWTKLQRTYDRASGSARSGWRHGFLGRMVAIVVLLMSGIGTGAVLGSVQSVQADETLEAASTLAALGTPEPVAVSDLVVEDSGASVAPASPGPAGQAAADHAAPAVPSAAPAPAVKVAPPAIAPVYIPAAGSAPAVVAPADCDRLDDKKINWLLDLVAKAKASNPDQAAVADYVSGQLRAVMGRNICAQEAQIYVGGMCADPAVEHFMDLMVKELPFYVRPLVGDPCTQDLVAAANKWLP